jgi:hypothetical protein
MAINYVLLFCCKAMSKNETFPKDIMYWDGWMDDNYLMEDVAKNMWERFPGALYSPSNMLILDTFLDIYMIN